jgi:hypothetical protein
MSTQQESDPTHATSDMRALHHAICRQTSLKSVGVNGAMSDTPKSDVMDALTDMLAMASSVTTNRSRA